MSNPAPAADPVPTPAPQPANPVAPIPVPAPAPQPRPAAPKPASSITGFSLKDALTATPSAEAKPEAKPDSPDAEMPEAEAEQRLRTLCPTLYERFTRTRPRLATAFSRAEVHGCRILLTIPNENLKEEIERNLLDLRREIRELSGVTRPVEFEIAIQADTRPDRPVKSADKLKFLTDQNPHLTALRKALDLDVD